MNTLMKTLTHLLNTVSINLTFPKENLTFHKDKMPALIPVRVVTKVNPPQR